MTATALIAAGAVVAAAMITAFASFVSLVNHKEQKISEFRQAWIDTLRSDLSRFFGEAEVVALRTDAFMKGESPDREAYLRDVAHQYGSLRTTLAQILMRLNPEEHHQLQAMLEEMGRLVHSSPVDVESLRNLRDRAVAESRTLLKTEWKRVKSGESWYKFTKAGTGVGALLIFSLALWLFLSLRG